MDWIVDVLDDWVARIRPLFSPGKLAALFVTERASRMSPRGLNVAFRQARDDAQLPAELDLHSLRHSYVTHLVEFDYPEKFVPCRWATSMRALQPSTPACPTNTATGCCSVRSETSTPTFGTIR